MMHGVLYIFFGKPRINVLNCEPTTGMTFYIHIISYTSSNVSIVSTNSCSHLVYIYTRNIPPFLPRMVSFSTNMACRLFVGVPASPVAFHVLRDATYRHCVVSIFQTNTTKTSVTWQHGYTTTIFDICHHRSIFILFGNIRQHVS